MEPALVPKGEVAGAAKGKKRGRYPVGIGLTGNGCKNDVFKRLTNIVVLDVLGHGRVDLSVYRAFNETESMLVLWWSEMTVYPFLIFIMDKRTLAQLVDAYADAKASRNQHLVNTMVAQLEQALDGLFPDSGDELEETTSSEF